MDQEEPMDFKALRAKFEQEEFTLKPPKNKPVIPEKPKVVSPPQSPTYHHLPSGARPSLLSTINENLERKTLFAPRVVFKDGKESKTPLISTNAKGKNKSEGKLKGGKDKTLQGSRENPEVSTAPKKANHKHKIKVLPLESTAELVEATPPPKVTTEKKKGLQIIKKSKRDSALISADPILDAPSSDVPGTAPLIPMPSELNTRTLHNSTPESLLPDSPTLPDYSDDVEISSPSTILESLAFNLPPPLIPHSPEPEIPSLNSEPPPEIENPALPDSRLASQKEIIPKALSASPHPPLVCAVSIPPPVVSTPSPPPSEPEITAESGKDAIYIPAEKKLPSSAINPPSIPPSPKAGRPISALSALERAEDMNHGKRTLPGDQRILNALINARKKTASPLTNLNQSYPVTPPPEEPSSSQSPTVSVPELPPIDYEDRIGNALPSKAEHINGFDHQQPGPLLNEITEGCDTPPELLVVPPPPPKTIISDTRPLSSSAAEPAISTSGFIPPPDLEFTEIPAPPEFSETYTPYETEIDIPDSVASVGHFPELPASEMENEKYTGPDVPDGQGLTKAYTNGITVPQTEIHTESPYGKISQMNPPPESPLTVGHDLPPASEPHTDDDAYQDPENVYEYVVTPEGGKKGVKTKVKKRKGQPKNPYVESTPETVQEKTKTGRFGKNEKKAAAEGPDEKELKKKEKQRLEKEKKELKEKQEREKKEQKEREKKENELKKKFKITGQEDALYKAKVIVTTKGRKTDLPVKTGDTISIIRTGNCPRGKWLARDSSNNYGYVSVDHVELDIKEMLQMGKKTMPSSNSNLIKPSRTRTSSQVSNHYQPTEDSFSDDSEEWTGDDEPFSSPDASNPEAPLGHTRTFSMPDMGNKDLNINHQHSRSDMGADSSHNQALQKLENFFHSQKSVESAASTTQPDISYTAGPACVLEEATHIPNKTQTSYTADSVKVAQEANHTSQTSSTEDTDFAPDKIILPPPDMYADAMMVQ